MISSDYVATELPTRIIYFGTPAYAVPALNALAADGRYDVSLVVTQPDRPAGRGHTLHEPMVKTAAKALGLPVYQPTSLRTAESRAPLVDADADIFVVAAYGIIFGPKTLAIPRLGCINLHASLLPRYRGASPISAALLAGDRETGVTLMVMDTGMDTGDVIATKSLPIGREETTGSLTERLANLGAELLTETLPGWIIGSVHAAPQPEAGASAVRPMVKADGWIDWTTSAAQIERQCRAMLPWPRCWTTLPGGTAMQVTSVTVCSGVDTEPGVVRVADKRVIVGCGQGSLALERVQPAGSAELEAFALINGRKLADGDRLGAIGAPAEPSPLIKPVD